jgi:hypothetical protein
MSKKDECIQLKNINYQTMLLNRNSNIDSNKTGENVEKYLEQEQEKKGKTQKPWSKLEKTTKLKKLYNYVESYGDELEITDKEKQALKKYLRTCLERKKLQRIKDVTYDFLNGIIKNIPGLSYSKSAIKFTLRRVDKKGSMRKSLAPKKTLKNNSKKKKKRRKSDKSRKKKNVSDKSKKNRKIRKKKLNKE